MGLESSSLSEVWSGLGVVHLVCVALVVVVCSLLRSRAAPKEAQDETPTSSAGRASSPLPSASGIKLREDPLLSRLPRGLDERKEPNMNDFPNHTHVQAILHRGDERDFIIDNPEDPYFFENDMCSGLILPMCRPTVETHLDKKGGWPYFDHFKGRKRLWEFRWRFKFKQPIKGNLRFGAMLRDYVPLNAMSKRSMKLVVAALRRVVGDDLYHSPGEPSAAGQETELPAFMMPLWAFDQVIETPEGEVPPALDDPNFSDYGLKRTDDKAAFQEYFSKLELQPGPTYTFAFWGISQFIDNHNWKMCKLLPFGIDFNAFCGRPPITICLYSLNSESMTEKDSRHLESRKTYCFKVDFWSSKKPPTKEYIKSCFPNVEEIDKPLDPAVRQRTWASFASGGCCSAQGRHAD